MFRSWNTKMSAVNGWYLCEHHVITVCFSLGCLSRKLRVKAGSRVESGSSRRHLNFLSGRTTGQLGLLQWLHMTNWV